MKVGISVYCKTCGREKQPHGRSVSPAVHGAYCDEECEGYRQEPRPGCLFPGETEEDFGNAVCANATKETSE